MKLRGRQILLILALGWFLGAASGLLFMRCVHPLMHKGHGGWFYRNRLAHELRLSPDQTRQVDAILQQSHERLDKIFEQDRPEIEAVRQDTYQQIRKLLTPDQQVRFDKFHAKMKERTGRYDKERLRRPSSSR
jgi:Spy/CpxP family protein refolding chaperone